MAAVERQEAEVHRQRAWFDAQCALDTKHRLRRWLGMRALPCGDGGLGDVQRQSEFALRPSAGSYRCSKRVTERAQPWFDVSRP
jgi:hypothetical protein